MSVYLDRISSVENGELDLNLAIFQNITFDGDGAAIYINQKVNSFILNCVFDSNTALGIHYSGAVYIRSSEKSKFFINKCCAVSNSAYYNSFGRIYVNCTLALCSIIKSELNDICLSFYNNTCQEVSSTNASYNTVEIGNIIFHYGAALVSDTFVHISNNYGKWIYGSNSATEQNFFRNINIVKNRYKEKSEVFHINSESSVVELRNSVFIDNDNFIPFFLNLKYLIIINVWVDKPFVLNSNVDGKITIEKSNLISMDSMKLLSVMSIFF